MRIAHLTDLHVLEDDAHTRRGADRVRLELLCNARPVDPRDRRERILRALRAAVATSPDHVCITGDLTEDGSDGQFEALAHLLAESGLSPEKVTLVPGNHDAYGDVTSYERALRGPLAPYRATSTPGTVLELEEVVLLPVSTVMAQPFVRAAGIVGDARRAELLCGLRHGERVRKPTIVAMHHPVVEHTIGAWQWFDGLVDAREVSTLFAAHRGAHVLHGHWHRHTDLRIGDDVRLRAHGALAVADHPRPLRVYEIEDGRVEIRAARVEPVRPDVAFS